MDQKLKDLLITFLQQSEDEVVEDVELDMDVYCSCSGQEEITGRDPLSCQEGFPPEFEINEENSEIVPSIIDIQDEETLKEDWELTQDILIENLPKLTEEDLKQITYKFSSSCPFDDYDDVDFEFTFNPAKVWAEEGEIKMTVKTFDYC